MSKGKFGASFANRHLCCFITDERAEEGAGFEVWVRGSVVRFMVWRPGKSEISAISIPA